MRTRTVPAPRTFVRTAGLIGLAAIVALIVQARTEGRFLESDHITRSAVYWLGEEVGTSMLVRTPNGISFTYQTSGLPAGQAVTLWVVVFNNPDACATDPCTVADMGNAAAQGDFLFGGGHVIGGSGRGNYGGHLAVGDTSGSGLAEIGGTSLGLIDPFTAEIQFALHSHGPAVPGQTLKAQLSSFLGGCEVFLGNADGIADGPEDIPVNVGECVTFQSSVHQP
jgi:hypothetical protein